MIVEEKTKSMNIVFLSTLLTPHQIPFCDELYGICNSFTFIQITEVGETWESKGEFIHRKDYPYLKQYSDLLGCKSIINDADVVLIGGCDLSVVKERLKAGKLVLVYLERFYKRGISIKNLFRCIVGTYIHHGRFQKYNVALMCASAYCAGDAAQFGNYKNKTYKWGYFPKMEKCEKKIPKDRNQIIWAGRLIDWKHPDYAVLAIKELIKEYPNVVLKIYGDGDEKNNLKSLIGQLDIANNVCIMGAASSEEVKLEMKKSLIFLSTSDYQEGWGVVLNEAMNCRCIVVASHAAGSTPFLINNGINGFVYESGNIQQIAEYCRKVLSDENLQRVISDNAYKTISEMWNPRVAARRFVMLSDALINGKNTPFDEGPCSLAYPIRQEDMYKIIIGATNA